MPPRGHRNLTVNCAAASLRASPRSLNVPSRLGTLTVSSVRAIYIRANVTGRGDSVRRVTGMMNDLASSSMTTIAAAAAAAALPLT